MCVFDLSFKRISVGLSYFCFSLVFPQPFLRGSGLVAVKCCCVPDLKLGVHVKRKLSLLLGLLSDRRGLSLYTPAPTFVNQLFKIEIPSEKSF